jgi:hypothetical protein
MPPGSSAPPLYPDEGGLAGPLGPSEPWEPSTPAAPAPSFDGASGSGTIQGETSIWDSITDYRPDVTTTSVLESSSNLLGAIPGVGNVMSAGNALYHGGSAIYDGVTGDRDGAVAHGAQALVSGLGAIPVVGNAIGGIDASIAGNSTLIRAGAEQVGLDPTQIPASIADLAAFTAVAGTNAVFGADDSNWIASGDKPTGTRGGEIGAGAMGLSYGVAGLLDSASFGIGSQVHAGGLQGMTEDVNSLVSPAMLGIAEYFGSDLAGPTSGVRKPDGSGSYAQTIGDHIHNAPGIVADSFRPPDTSPIEVPVRGPTLPPDDLLY